MQVILLEKVRNLGNLGDSVKVRSGYGRNFLIPQGKAVFASEKNSAVFEARRAELEQKAAERLKVAEERAVKLRALSIEISALASDEGKLYGSVGPNEVAEAINAAGVEVTRREVSMPAGPIHMIGEHGLEVLVHSDVAAALTITITASK